MKARLTAAVDIGLSKKDVSRPMESINYACMENRDEVLAEVGNVDVALR